MSQSMWHGSDVAHVAQVLASAGPSADFEAGALALGAAVNVPVQANWHKNEIAALAQTLMTIAPSAGYAAGVMAVATAVGARVTAPALANRLAVTIFDDHGREVRR